MYMPRITREREIIEVQGQKILWSEFAQAIKVWISKNYEYAFKKSEHLRGVAYTLVDMAYDYAIKGKDTISDSDETFFTKCGYNMEQKKFPEVFDSLVRQTIDKEGSVFNISSYLNDAARTTSYGAERREKLHNAEDQRRECVRNILKDFSGDTSTARGKIDMILYLQDMKKKVNYVNTEEDLEYEAQAFNLWVHLLGHSMFSNVINKAQMEMLVQDRFMDESEMTKLLKKEGYEWDYEYYSEDAFANLSGDTKIRIDDVLQIVEPRFREVLYID